MSPGFEQFPSPDPSRSSLREEALNLELVGTESRRAVRKTAESKVYVDKKTGERFHKIGRGEKAKLASLLIKGPINVADVVKVNGEYFSHEQNSEHILAKEGWSASEIAADQSILRNVFGAPDHIYYPPGQKHRQEAEEMAPDGKAPIIRTGSQWVEHQNILADEDGGKHVFFDFKWNDLAPSNDDQLSTAELKEFFLRNLKKEELSWGGDRREALSIIQDKLAGYETRYSEDQFSSFDATVQRSGYEMTASEKEELFKKIRTRIGFFKEAVQKEIAELPPSATPETS